MLRIRDVGFSVVLFLGLALSGSTAMADSITVFNTGESSGGSALASGSLDPHYSLISAPSGVPLTALATSANSAWAPNTSTADWISPGSSGYANWPSGNYDYQTTFDLTGLDPSSAVLTGSWTSDNSSCIYLNGVNTGNCVGAGSFAALVSFSLNSGFVTGVNTLDFVVNNLGLPSGVIAEVSGTASASGVPEPISMSLAGAGLCGLALVLKHKII